MSDETLTETKSATWNDLRIEVIIGALLRIGVLLAALVVMVGAGLYLVRHGHEVVNYSAFHGQPAALTHLSSIVHGAFALNAHAVIQLGLLLLIATPIARVIFSAVAFAMEHDYMYVLITLIVLAVLMYSLFGSS
jgi:uncharacterized membrane protein